jgi:hypothetical protein
MSRFFALATSTIKNVAATQHHLADYYIGKLERLECGRHIEIIFPDGPLGPTDFAYARSLGPEVSEAVSQIFDAVYDFKEASDELESRRLPN